MHIKCGLLTYYVCMNLMSCGTVLLDMFLAVAGVKVLDLFNTAVAVYHYLTYLMSVNYCF